MHHAGGCQSRRRAWLLPGAWTLTLVSPNPVTSVGLIGSDITPPSAVEAERLRGSGSVHVCLYVQDLVVSSMREYEGRAVQLATSHRWRLQEIRVCESTELRHTKPLRGRNKALTLGAYLCLGDTLGTQGDLSLTITLRCAKPLTQWATDTCVSSGTVGGRRRCGGTPPAAHCSTRRHGCATGSVAWRRCGRCTRRGCSHGMCCSEYDGGQCGWVLLRKELHH